MKFTDDQLRDLKACLASPSYLSTDLVDIQALIGRLEAAEAVCGIAKDFRLFQSWEHPKCTCAGCALADLYEMWKIASGK